MTELQAALWIKQILYIYRKNQIVLILKQALNHQHMKNVILWCRGISNVISSCSRSFSLCCFCVCFVMFFARIMSWNCLFYESKSLQNFKGYVSIFWILCVQKENNKNRNEIVLYFIYNRTFQYSDMSLIYLFTNIFIHFVQVWKSGFCRDWMFLCRNWPVPSQMYQPAFIPIICK